MLCITGITRALLEWKKSLATTIDDFESTPLRYAASVGNLAAVKLLLRHDTSAAYMADKKGLYPIHIAAKCGRREALVINELIEQIPDSDELLDKEGRNFLHIAIMSGKGKTIRHIRRNPTFLRMLNARDYQGNTPLHLAAQGEMYGIVRFLISMRMVYSSIMNRHGLTPVDLSLKLVDRGFRYTLVRIIQSFPTFFPFIVPSLFTLIFFINDQISLMIYLRFFLHLSYFPVHLSHKTT